jgi:muramidase (phage lysozyme)
MVSRVALVGAAGLLAYGAWLMTRPEETTTENESGGDWLGSADNILTDASQTTAEFIDTITGNTMRLSNMSRVTAADMAHPNVQAMLRVIRRGEGTADEAGYRRLFGGKLFESFADHPRTPQTFTLRNGQRITSTAAGAYQFLATTWDETRRIMALPDFTPRSQDWGAVGRIAARGALEDVKAGRFDTAIQKIAREWASMPGSPYGQPVISWDVARTTYASAGGNLSA